MLGRRRLSLNSGEAVGVRVVTDTSVIERARENSRQPPAGGYQRVGKRVFDVVFSSCFLLAVGSWLFPIIALAIRVETRGPLIFRQKRVGLGGEIFECFKFRTMRYEPAAAFMQASPLDARVTRVGGFLRRHNLDEMPQFVNVLRGEMSVVGPRPHVPELDDYFQERIPGYGGRIAVMPGITGLAQIRGYRGETRTLRQMMQRVRLDVFYVQRCSFTLDLYAVITTMWRSVRGDSNAY